MPPQPPNPYTYKTKPYNHQRIAFEATRDEAILAVLWEMGTGKSKLIIDQAAWNYQQGRIDGLLIWAPAGVHRLWNDLEVPKHLPDQIPRCTVTWLSGRMESRAARDDLTTLLSYDGLSILTMNVEAAITKHGLAFATKFMKARRTMAVCDESQVIKNPGAARTKRLIALGKQAVMRRITTGTPITQGPLDLFTQYHFLDRDFWMRGSAYEQRIASYWAFKHRYGRWRQVHLGGRKFEELVSYQNLDELTARCATTSIRATKAECLDLPDKVYTTRTFSLTPHQRQVYNQLRDEYIAELTTQAEVKVVHVLTRLLRLQQVASGYWPETREGIECPHCHGAGCDPCHDIGMVIHVHAPEDLVERAKNPRLLATLDLLENNPGSMIIWCRFRYDVDLLIKHIPEAVRYDGSTSSDDRARAVARFQNGTVRVLVGTPRAGGRGLTLTRASTVLYYSHDFSYETRIQSEDRAHRIGLQHSVTYVDLVAEDSVDRHLLDVVAGKRDLASLFDRADPAAFLR